MLHIYSVNNAKYIILDEYALQPYFIWKLALILGYLKVDRSCIGDFAKWRIYNIWSDYYELRNAHLQMVKWSEWISAVVWRANTTGIPSGMPIMKHNLSSRHISTCLHGKKKRKRKFSRETARIFATYSALFTTKYKTFPLIRNIQYYRLYAIICIHFFWALFFLVLKYSEINIGGIIRYCLLFATKQTYHISIPIIYLSLENWWM